LSLAKLEFDEYVIEHLVDEHGLERFNALRGALKFGVEGAIPEGRTWIIYSRRDSRDCGYLRVVPFRDGEQELGFALIPEARGKGIMSAVLPRFVSMLNENFYTETSDQNIAAIRVIEKAGFKSCMPVHPEHVTPHGETVRTAAFRLAAP